MGLKTSPSSSSPTSPPTSAFATINFDTIKNILAVFSGHDALYNVSTPQYKALDCLTNASWISGVDINIEEAYLQRYALATLYFAINADELVSNNAHECTWEGATCEGETITEIDLGYSYVTNSKSPGGRIPEEIGLLTFLTYLNLHRNALIGSLPTEVGYMQNLNTLSLRWNALTGSLPSEIGQMQNLQELDLFWNSFSSSIPSEVGQMQNLETLDLSWNTFTGSIPSEVGQMQQLDEIHLENNTFSVSVDAFCGIEDIWIIADCAESNARLNCSCCTACCDENGLCNTV